MIIRIIRRNFCLVFQTFFFRFSNVVFFKSTNTNHHIAKILFSLSLSHYICYILIYVLVVLDDDVLISKNVAFISHPFFLWFFDDVIMDYIAIFALQTHIYRIYSLPVFFLFDQFFSSFTFNVWASSSFSIIIIN